MASARKLKNPMLDFFIWRTSDDISSMPFNWSSCLQATNPGVLQIAIDQLLRFWSLDSHSSFYICWSSHMQSLVSPIIAANKLLGPRNMSKGLLGLRGRLSIRVGIFHFLSKFLWPFLIKWEIKVVKKINYQFIKKIS